MLDDRVEAARRARLEEELRDRFRPGRRRRVLCCGAACSFARGARSARAAPRARLRGADCWPKAMKVLGHEPHWSQFAYEIVVCAVVVANYWTLIGLGEVVGAEGARLPGGADRLALAVVLYDAPFLLFFSSSR